MGFWELSVRRVGAVVSAAFLPEAPRSPSGSPRKTLPLASAVGEKSFTGKYIQQVVYNKGNTFPKSCGAEPREAISQFWPPRIFWSQPVEKKLQERSSLCR